MKLQALLDIHDKHNDGLKDNLGDGFLLTNNHIYSSIRKAAKESGFKFSSQTNNLYQALPLSQLESILESKIIPYYDNVSVLRDVRQKSSLIVWDDIVSNLKRNHLFHESSHAVARSLSDKILHKEKLNTPSDQSKVLHLLLEESFANTCELLAVIDCDDAAHRIYYELNSYTALFKEKTNLKNALSDFGRAPLTTFVFLSYLHANFLCNEFDEKTFTDVITFSFGKSKFEPKQLKTLRAISRLAFSLDEDFRTTTTNFYLKLQDITDTNIFKINIMKYLQTSASHKTYIQKLVSTLTTN